MKTIWKIQNNRIISLNIVSEGEFTEVKLSERTQSDQGQDQENCLSNSNSNCNSNNLSLGNTISSKEITEGKNENIEILLDLTNDCED